MKSLIIILFLTICVNNSFCQQNKQYIKPDNMYSKTRIFLNNNQIIKSKKLILKYDTVVTLKIKDSACSYISIRDINFITTKRGSYVLAGALVGGGIGLLSSALSIAKYGATVSDGTIITVCGTLGCTLIGSIIGICIPKWRRLYPNIINTSQ